METSTNWSKSSRVLISSQAALVGLLTLVVTDLDAGQPNDGKNPAAQPKRKAGQKTNNSSLKTWAPKFDDVDDLYAAPPEKKILSGDQLFAVAAI